jgi:hypothetical protein
MALQHLRSSTANKRPLPAGMSDGQLAINTNLASPGLFLKNSNGDLVKVGPVHVGTTAPNVSPAAGGETGNTTGELWLDTSLTPNELKTWNGSSWVSATGQEIPVSKLIDGSARQLLQTDAAGTGVEWTSNVDVPGTLDVTSTATFDSIASHPLGSAGAPTITFTGDTNTGIYSPGADQVAISTAGSGRLRIDASGRVITGANLTSYVGGSVLYPTSNGVIDLNSNVANVPAVLKLGNTGFSNTASYSTGAIEFRGFDSVGNTMGYASIEGLISDATAATRKGDIIFKTINASTVSEKLRITSAGLVGIGTSSPSEKLEVQNGFIATYDTTNAIGAGYSLRFYTNGGPGAAKAEMARIGGIQETGASSNSGNLQFGTRASGTVATRMILTSSGNLGIGTTSPQDTFHLNTTSGSTTARISSSTNTSGLQITARGDGTGTQLAAFGTSSDLRFFTTTSGGSTNEALRVDSNQRLLVGTSTYSGGTRAVFRGNTAAPGTQGVIVLQRDGANPGTTQSLGEIRFVDSNDGFGASISATPDGGWSSPSDCPTKLVFSTTADGASSPTERMRITNRGSLQIKSDAGIDTVYLATPTGAGTSVAILRGSHSASSGYVGTDCIYIYANGNVVNTNNSYGAISDIKLKENIVDASSQWDDLKALQVVNYNFKEGQTHTQIGLVAQEAELVSPGLVSESPDRDEDGNDLGTVTKSVNYSVLYMKAVKALQEAMERIETLEGMVAVNNITIDEQQHQLSTLAARLTALESA